VEEIEKELENKLTTVEICEILLILVYQRKIEVYNNKLTVNKQEKLKISDRYRKYVEYFAETKFPVISSYGLSGINDLGLDLLRANVMLLFDGTRTDDYILEILKEKHARDEIRVDNLENNTVETILKDYVTTMRTIIEENFLNK
jgi:methyltransferase